MKKEIENKQNFTKDYSKFSLVKENRMIDNNQVKKLKKIIMEKNKSHLFPIIINKNWQIIDGQHRFFALKELNLPIYYMIDEDYELIDIVNVNINNKNWNSTDYLKFYTSQVKTQYMVFDSIMKQYKFSLTDTLYIIGDVKLNNPHKDFKSGNLKLKPVKEIEFLCPLFFKLKTIFRTTPTTLISSILYIYYNINNFDFDRLIKKLNDYKKVRDDEKLEPKDDIFNQTRFFEDVYNLNLRNNVLFADKKKIKERLMRKDK